MQTIPFNGSIVATNGIHIVIKDTIQEAQIELSKQTPPKNKKSTPFLSLSEQIAKAKQARQSARLVQMFSN